MKVLLCIEDSPCSESAVNYLLKMSWAPGTHVICLSVSPQPPVFYGEAYGAWVEIDEKVTEEGLKYHRELAEAAVKRLVGPGRTAEARTTTGDPRVEILTLAEQEKPDLIVLGSHGRSGLSKLMLGSVASHVVTHAHRPVLVVK